MRDSNKFEDISLREYKDNKLKGLVLNKIIKEYNKFIDLLYQMYPNEIVELSEEKICKEDLINCFINSNLSDEEYRLLLGKDHLLNSLYFNSLYLREKSKVMLEGAFKDTINDIKGSRAFRNRELEKE